jgi:hypothetical protein
VELAELDDRLARTLNVHRDSARTVAPLLRHSPSRVVQNDLSHWRTDRAKK